MSFYSYFDWHNCPSPERISLTIKKKPVNGVNVTETKGLKSQKVRVKFKKVAGAKKYQVKIGKLSVLHESCNPVLHEVL